MFTFFFYDFILLFVAVAVRCLNFMRYLFKRDVVDTFIFNVFLFRIMMTA